MEKNLKLNRLITISIIITFGFVSLSLIMPVSAICPDDCPNGMISYWYLDELVAGPVIDCYNGYDGTNL